MGDPTLLVIVILLAIAGIAGTVILLLMPARERILILDGRSPAKTADALGFLLLRKSHSDGTLLKGARHAVLGTLYSLAHRIGLDGTSYLLDSLCKNLSSGFFVVVVVCALLCPAPELVVLAEEQL